MLALILMFACGADDPSPGEKPPALVELARVDDGTLADRWSVPGDVVALEQAELAVGADGPVATLSVREGDRVRAGDLLLTLQLGLVTAQRDQARARAAEARLTEERLGRDLERLEGVDAAILAAAELDAARTAAAAATARREALDAAAREAQARVARQQLVAPFDGVVTARHADPGDWVTAGQHLLTVVSADDAEIRVDVSAHVAHGIDVDDPVTLESAGTGRVAGIVPTLDPTSRTSLVRITPDADGLVPGRAVQVVFDLAIERPGAVRVPRDALVLGPVETRIMKVVDGTAASVAVEVLASTEQRALVVGDISPGDEVVTRGNERLRPGQAVKVLAQDD